MTKAKYFFTVLLLLILTAYTTNLFAQNWDISLLKNINPEHPNSGYWKTTSSSAYWLPAAVSVGTLVAGLASDDGQLKHNAFETFLSVGISTLVSTGVKNIVNRERPADRYPGEIFTNSPTHGQSFPSGHTVLAFSTATTLTLQYKKWYVAVPAFLWASSVGCSRLYLGKHYPSDVIGGMAVGVGGALATHWLNKKLSKSYYKTPHSSG